MVKNSKYLLNLGTRNRINNVIFELCINNGHIIIANKDILHEIRIFTVRYIPPTLETRQFY